MKKMIQRIAVFALLALPAAGAMAVGTAGGPASEIQLSTDHVAFTGQGGRQTVKVLKGKNYELFYRSDWMTCKQQKNGTLEISAARYDFFCPRTASVVLTSKKTNYSRVISVSQADRGDRPAVIKRPGGSHLLFLSDMDLSKSTFYYIKSICKNRSVDGDSIRLKGSAYTCGIGTHAPSILTFRVMGAKRFVADLGIDDEVVTKQNTPGFGIASYDVLLDGKSVKQGELRLDDRRPVTLDVDLKNARVLTLKFDAGASTYGDHISLGNARFVVDGEQPVNISEADAKALMCAGAGNSCGQCAKACDKKQPGCGDCKKACDKKQPGCGQCAKACDKKQPKCGDCAKACDKKQPKCGNCAKACGKKQPQCGNCAKACGKKQPQCGDCAKACDKKQPKCGDCKKACDKQPQCNKCAKPKATCCTARTACAGNGTCHSSAVKARKQVKARAAKGKKVAKKTKKPAKKGKK
jgi:hypothetical protein